MVSKNIQEVKGDIHKLPFIERRKILESLDLPQSTWVVPNLELRLNLSKGIWARDREELKKGVEKLRVLPGSEGTVTKTSDFEYNLKGIRSGMVKYHNSTEIYGKVLEIKETKVKGVYNYYFGFETGKYKMKTEKLGNEFYHRSGRTFSTSIKADIGDVLEIEGETLNAEHDLKVDVWKLSLWAPRVMQKVDRKADTTQEAMERAKKNLCLQEKEIKREGKTIYLSEVLKIKDIDYKPEKPNNKQLADDWRIANAWYSSIKRGREFKYSEEQVVRLARIICNEIRKRVREKRMKHEFKPEEMKRWAKNLYERVSKNRVEKQADPYMEYPKPEKKRKYVIQRHFRGEGHHLDLRIKYSDYLLGWTIADAIKGKPGRTVLTSQEAKALEQNEISKIDWDKGVPKLRPGIKPGFKKKYAELAAMRKSPEPGEWLNVQGVTPKGEVGGTRELPGVFQIIDKGECEIGANKPYFHELFFSDGKLKGRWFFRQLSPAEFKGKTEKQEVIPPSRETVFREEAPWFLVKPLDETPYVISKAAVDKNWIPPQGVSALPEHIRKQIPEKFQYWEIKEEKNRIANRNELVKEKIIKLSEILMTPYPNIKNIVLMDYEFETYRDKSNVLRYRTEIQCPSCKKIRWVDNRNIKKSKYFFGLCLRCLNGLKGKFANGYKEGRWHQSDGYIGILASEVEPKFQCMQDSRGYIYEHRYVMSKKLGRPLTELELVHHLNGVKDDNRLENLELVNESEHILIKKLEKRIRDLEGTVSKPYIVDHSCRLHSPKEYERFFRQNCKIKHNGKCINLVFGVKQGKSEIQSMRYPKNIWTSSEAKKHCNSKKGTFEPARIEKGLNQGSNWGRAAYYYVLSQQQDTLWAITPQPEKVKRVQRALEEFMKLKPFKTEWINGTVEWLERRPNEMKAMMIDLIQVRKAKEIPFCLQWHFFRGPRIIRAGVSSEHYDLRLNFSDQPGLMHFVLNQNPLKNNEVTAFWKPCKYKEWMEVSQYLPPANERAKMSKEELKKLPPGIEEANPTKATPAYMKIIDSGNTTIYEDSESWKKFSFRGKKLKGLWTFEKEGMSKFWIMKKSEFPKPE